MANYPFNTSNVPPGGLTGQVLTKESNSSYDVGWHDAGAVDVERNVNDILDEKLNSLNGKPNQVLGFDDDGKIVAMDVSASSGGECNCPPIATDEEVDEVLDEVFGWLNESSK